VECTSLSLIFFSLYYHSLSWRSRFLETFKGNSRVRVSSKGGKEARVCDKP
jgi:hypothetical protein